MYILKSLTINFISCSYHKHSTILDNLCQTWEDFYTQYQSSLEWVNETNREVSSISPELDDPMMVKGQVMRLKARKTLIAQ